LITSVDRWLRPVEEAGLFFSQKARWPSLRRLHPGRPRGRRHTSGEREVDLDRPSSILLRNWLVVRLSDTTGSRSIFQPSDHLRLWHCNHLQIDSPRHYGKLISSGDRHLIALASRLGGPRTHTLGLRCQFAGSAGPSPSGPILRRGHPMDWVDIAFGAVVALGLITSFVAAWIVVRK